VFDEVSPVVAAFIVQAGDAIKTGTKCPEPIV
jgi:hypothetical protein